MVTWRTTADYLHCNPKFHNHSRYDCVIVRTVDQDIFAQLILVFTFEVDGVTYPIALIHPYDAAIGQHRQKDKDLGLYRVRAKPRAAAEFISARSIVRGTYIVPEFS